MYRISHERDIIRDEIITRFFLNLSKKIQSYIKKCIASTTRVTTIFNRLFLSEERIYFEIERKFTIVFSSYEERKQTIPKRENYYRTFITFVSFFCSNYKQISRVKVRTLFTVAFVRVYTVECRASYETE